MTWTNTNPVTLPKVITASDYNALWWNIDFIYNEPVGELMPVSGIATFMTQSIPTGYLFCDGSAISRTTYSDLYAEIGVTYGSGDGSTTFNIPDFRGRFLRQRASGSTRDPDRGSRSNRGDGTTGDNVGTTQTDEIENHRHVIESKTHAKINATAGRFNNSNEFTGHYTNYSGGNESRPVNINVKYCIKY